MSLLTLDVEVEKLLNSSLGDTEFYRKRDYLLAREQLSLEVAKHNAENKIASSFANPTTVIATVAIVVSILQVVAAWKTSQSQTSFNGAAVIHQEKTLKYQKEVDDKKARQELSVKFAEFVVTNQKELFAGAEGTPTANDLRKRCNAVRAMNIAFSDEIFRSVLQSYQGDQPYCANDQLITSEARRLADGAPVGWTRRGDNQSLLSQSFAVRTTNLHNQQNSVATGGFSLTLPMAPNARIYRIEYQCAQYTCGWSYNPDGGYTGNVQLSDDKRSFSWKRKWDGDSANEVYVAYYEVPLQTAPP